MPDIRDLLSEIWYFMFLPLKYVLLFHMHWFAFYAVLLIALNTGFEAKPERIIISVLVLVLYIIWFLFIGRKTFGEE